MRQLSRLLSLRAHCFSSSLSCRPVFSTPPALAHPSHSFTTTPARCKYQVPKRKHAPTATMAGDMTTFKGKPFDRPSLESLMRVCSNTASPRGSHHRTY